MMTQILEIARSSYRNKITLFLLCTLAFFSCSAELDEDILRHTAASRGSSSEDSRSAVLTASMSTYSFEKQTRTSLSDDLTSFTWEQSDKIGLYYQDGTTIASAAFTILNSGGSVGTFSNSAFKLNENSTYYAFYPYGSKSTPTSAIVSYQGQVQNGNGSTAHLGTYNYMSAVVETNDAGGANIQFNNLGCIAQIKLQVSSTDNYKSLNVYSKKGLLVAQATFDMTSESFSAKDLTTSINLSFGEGIQVNANEEITAYMMMAPTDLEGDELTFQLVGESQNYTFASVAGKNMVAGKVYQYEADTVKTLKILCIGNSYSLDALDYLSPLLKSVGINFSIGIMYRGSCPLSSHVSNWENSVASYVYYKNPGSNLSLTRNVSLQTAIQDEDWDIICFHEFSEYSGNTDSIAAYLPTLIENAKAAKPNAEIAYLMTPAWGKDNTGYGEFYTDQEEMYNSIVNVGQYIQNNYKVDYLIPVVTAIQNARQTSLDSYGSDLFASSTDRHLEDGIGRLIASYSVFNTLIGSKYHISLDLSCFLPIYGENVVVTSFPQTSSFVPVTESMAKLGMKCAEAAEKNKFAVTKISE